MPTEIAKGLIGIGIGTILTAFAIKRAKEVSDREAKKRAQIKKNTDDTIIAMAKASGVISERLKRGDYDGKPFQAVIDDWNFESVVKFND